ncbi:asparaginase [Nocardioides marmorisolisilvae]|uniref:Asparaginase n=1 Tax=Nocardioides marmorisolisilvae TaxID=1542737 RepID=A0A3N0DPA2_9ACTN|nr:asparaginase [Nocardioides marmorisolisilvae]RNL77480.1 asparaginase [Nocardioides marmorisolisilvae]
MADAVLVERSDRPDAVVAEVVRSGFVEGAHRGTVVALAADGSRALEIGDADATMLPRSCSKPLQALAMVRAGLDLDGELLALACASHSGEPFHLDGVRRILAGVGLDESALQNPPGWPLADAAEEALIRAGGEQSVLAMNCSGKHAAMLATCVANGWSTDDYLSPAHPLQQAIAATIAELTGIAVEVAATDGCGAPLLSTSVTGLARAFSVLATSEEPAAQRVAGAIRAHPEWVSGTTRDELVLLRAIPGAIAKAGAEACYVVALDDGRAFALKISDGAARARPVVMAALLTRLGVDVEAGVDTAAVRSTGAAPLLGGSVVVGEIRAAF